MRTLQEIQKITERNTVEKAAREVVDSLSTRLAARNLGTVAHLPPVLTGYPIYDDDGNAIEYMRYGDEYGVLPLRGSTE